MTIWRGQRGAHLVFWKENTTTPRHTELATNIMVLTRNNRTSSKGQHPPRLPSKETSQQIYLNKPAEVLALPQFWGLDHEDPNTFLNECKEKLATTN